MFRKFFFILLLTHSFSYLNSQLSLKHSIGISGIRNNNIIEYYDHQNGENLTIRASETKILFSMGGKYFTDFDKNIFFLRSGLGVNYNKMQTSVVDSYVSFGIPIYLGLNIYRFKIFGGLENSFNAYKFSTLNGTKINKELCLCELNYFQSALKIGFEFSFYTKFNLGILLNIAPKNYLVSEGIGRIDKSQNNHIFLTYQL